MVLVLSSCSENKPTNSNIESSIVSNEENDKALKETLIEAEKAEQEMMKSFTTMSFDKVDHDFGSIKEDTDNKVLFKVNNTGKYPLIISRVSASCGCTSPKKPTEPIAPGKSDVIEVIFHPTNSTQKEQTKTITVEANTDPQITILSIHASVLPK
jgi:hypothetical protein